MRAQGATENNRRDRGNYAAGSTVMNNNRTAAASFQQPGGRAPSRQEGSQAYATIDKEVCVGETGVVAAGRQGKATLVGSG
jgi:hypothetical protein